LVVSDTEVLESLEFEPDLPCMASSTAQCPHPARWYVMCRACEYPGPRCDAHLLQLQMIATLMPQPFKCYRCGKIAPSFAELVNIVPIKVHS
jgi:hypothetical protein